MSDDILIHISPYAVWRVVWEDISPAPWVMLFDLVYFVSFLFLKLGVGGGLTRADFLGDQMRWHRHKFLSCRSRQALKRLATPAASKYIFHPSSQHTINPIWLGTCTPITLTRHCNPKQNFISGAAQFLNPEQRNTGTKIPLTRMNTDRL